MIRQEQINELLNVAKPSIIEGFKKEIKEDAFRAAILEKLS